MPRARRASFAAFGYMSHLRIYLRVIALLAPEKGLTALLLLANLGLAGGFFLEPWLFGRVVDALATGSPTAAGSR